MERREQTTMTTVPSVKQLINRFENAVHQAARDDYVDGGSYAAMDRRAQTVITTKQALLDAFDDQHAALVEQRDRLARALEVIRDSFWSEDEPAEERVEHLQQLATDALAAVEQGDEGLAKGGSG